MRELGDEGDALHRELGRFVAGGTWDGLIVVGALGACIAEGAESAGFDGTRVHRCATCRDAAGIAAQRIGAGCAVLVKGSRAMRLEDVLDEWRAATGKPGYAGDGG
jgi:UDP-N-acetylmuramoyl-tripeptide--D-alanyl-D-alanine ligase